MAAEFTAAARALEQTLAGVHLDQALDASCERLPPASRPAARDIAYGAVRDHGYTRFVAARLNKRPPPAATAALQSIAISQLRQGRRAPAIVVDQVVRAAREADEAGLRAAAGFLNATLRRFTRERADIDAAARGDPEASTGHPRWWTDLLRSAWPTQAEAILAESLRQAPMTLRVNRGKGRGAHLTADLEAELKADPKGAGRAGGEADRKAEVEAEVEAETDVEAAQARLDAAGLAAFRSGAAALTLAQAVPVSAIPGFSDGDFTVQDAGAQLAAPLLMLRDGDRVLDACAAPGGKTTQLLQLAACRVLALDIDARRAARIGENLARERLPVIDWHDEDALTGAAVLTADASEPSEWWDGQPFDRILVDAPCSASGIVRRHPDVLWHRRRSDPATFGRQQQRLLRALWPLLKPGGKLLYVTCSIFPQEGDAVIDEFCSQNRNCERESLVASWADGDQPLTQLFPTSAARRNHDGYYFALLNKQT